MGQYCGPLWVQDAGRQFLPQQNGLILSAFWQWASFSGSWVFHGARRGTEWNVNLVTMKTPWALEFFNPNKHSWSGQFVWGYISFPSASRNIQVDSPYEISRAPDELHYTYLDTFGRPVIVAYKKNLVEQHIQDIVVCDSTSILCLLRLPSKEWVLGARTCPSCPPWSGVVWTQHPLGLCGAARILGCCSPFTL